MNDNLFSVESPEELLLQLEKTDISHPPVGLGATKEQLERCVCFRFLSTFARESHIAFPLKLFHTDRPDFRLVMNSSTIGVECTLAVTEQLVRALSLREQHCPNVWIDLSDFRWGCPDRTNSEIIAVLKKGKFTAAPWYGESADREWALAIKDSIDAKSKKLNASGFLRSNENWLLIDDDFTPQSILDINKCLFYLSPKIQEYFVGSNDAQARFDEILVRHQEIFIRLTATTVNTKPINDLWQKHGN